MTPLTLKFVAPQQAGGYGGEDLPLTLSVFAARWMLKQVQHDAARSIPLRPLRLCVNPNNRRPGAGWSDGDVSARMKATRS
jgi:hypothetical protein